SLAKAKAIQDLASKTIERQIPSFDQLARLTDDEIVEITTRVRGVGIWTAQMFLIFRLGRLDVMPSTDYGVRKGFARLYLKAGADLPEPQEIEKHARLWQPYRSVASWYMWRVLELESWLK
ncbi:MAG: hypothetical protein K8F91_25500, partial [Candidatus Obscuribacterales bacterium]|nr:hypothetical protein [Candidatus Obscuribacterales bacterium]